MQTTVYPWPVRSVLVHVGRVFLDHRVVGLLRMQRIGDRAFEGLVMFRERTVGHSGQRHEYPARALGVHDERAHVVFGLLSRL